MLGRSFSSQARLPCCCKAEETGMGEPLWHLLQSVTFPVLIPPAKTWNQPSILDVLISETLEIELHLVNHNFFHSSGKMKWRFENLSIERLNSYLTTNLMGKIFNKSNPEKARQFNVPAKSFLRFKLCIIILKISLVKITGPQGHYLFVIPYFLTQCFPKQALCA